MCMTAFEAGNVYSISSTSTVRRLVVVITRPTSRPCGIRAIINDGFPWRDVFDEHLSYISRRLSSLHPFHCEQAQIAVAYIKGCS
jgi:hypothetical protein